MEMPDVPFNKDLTYLGITTYRDKNQLFGIKRKDRRQHVYVLGKSGTGKSVLLFNMIIQNIINGEGVCVVDPHGELVEAVLSAIPENRMKDVVYFNPADVDYHIGFNVLELVDPQYKHLVASGLMGIFTKIWANAWSARMEYILNNCILALLDTPGTTLLGIPRLLVDKDYRQKIINNLKDPVIKAFWVHEYEAWQDKFRNEAIAPIQNKVGQFLSTAIIRNVVGQSQSTINIFNIMNEGKIFLVNVSKGRIGEDNSGLLGGMIITKIQLAAMERVRIPEENRKDFYLYVDEFQNFVTEAFAGILSEARKYRLNLTVAHQYTAQLVVDKSSSVRDAVFGNVGTMIVFRVGADDADFLEKEFDPEFTPQDIVSLPNYKIYLKLMIDGVTSRPFSAKTLPPLVKGGNLEVEDQVIKSSRELYCKPREAVEKEIMDWSGMALGDIESGNVASPIVTRKEDGSLEKFPIICSNCGLQKSVPFKPEPGRPAYCKECIAKIKSGEVKVDKSAYKEMRVDDSKYYKPLADLGIEFAQPNSSNGAKEKKPEPKPEQNQERKPEKQGFVNSVKKVFTSNNNNNNKDTKPPMRSDVTVTRGDKFQKDNAALKDVLNKTLSGAGAAVVVDSAAKVVSPRIISPIPFSILRVINPEVLEQTKEIKKEEPKKEVPIKVEEKPVQIVPEKKEIVKEEIITPKIMKPLNDRAATPDKMNSLKALIQSVSVQPKELPQSTPIPVTPKVEEKKEEKKPEPKPEPVVATPPKIEEKKEEKSPEPEKKGTEPPLTKANIKEVPEDVLKKLLE